jgi:hypothetical protein
MWLRRFSAMPMVVKAFMAEKVGTLSCAPSGLNGKSYENSEEEECAGTLDIDIGDAGMGVGRQHMSGIG